MSLAGEVILDDQTSIMEGLRALLFASFVNAVAFEAITWLQPAVGGFIVAASSKTLGRFDDASAARHPPVSTIRISLVRCLQDAIRKLST